MPETSRAVLTNTIREAAYPLRGSRADYDPLMDLIGVARFVLLDEASHGTHEFYNARAEITRRLITEKGFNAVAVEADWPDAYRVNRYVQNIDDDQTGQEALAGFRRFPIWMWRNTDVLAFIEWLRSYNRARAEYNQKAGFYGLDLYSLYASAEAVINYLERVDPEAAKRARYRYSCFEHFKEAALPNFLLALRNDGQAAPALRGPRLERAIGVIYLPRSERISHYFFARLPEQFDAILHFDETRAVNPLDRTETWEAGEPPETYPTSV